MGYLEIIVTITAIASVWNAILQSGWFVWSKNIHDRKHFTDDEINTEIDLIHSIQAYVDAKIENELVIKTRDQEWAEFMETSKRSAYKDEIKNSVTLEDFAKFADTNELDSYVPFGDMDVFKDIKYTEPHESHEMPEDPNAHLELNEDGKYNHEIIDGKLDTFFESGEK